MARVAAQWLARSTFFFGYTIAQHFFGEWPSAFSLLKSAMRYPAYRAVFRWHIISTFVALATCGGALLARASSSTREHRWLGRAYVMSVVAGVLPSAALMLPYASGSLVSRSVFVMATLLLFVSAGAGYASARKREFARHRVSMIWTSSIMAFAPLQRVLAHLVESYDMSNALALALVAGAALGLTSRQLKDAK